MADGMWYPISSMCWAFIELLRYPNDEAFAHFMDSDAGYTLFFNKIEEEVKLEIYHYGHDFGGDDKNRSRGEKVFEGNHNFDKFLNHFINVLHPFEDQEHVQIPLCKLIEVRREEKKKN